ncbi:hypothetical protein B0H65DRAFT_451904 [Neurospora tetraspora]|uniref:CFEM domain-containing protein n=1 Tax=Neurospora tetraspora TaxID=94610 RepID=A0AAE0JQ41_9PEZI|nr:hypothetical protein B0H65DRAFT_451904 [Neurospora tetraspora]
MAFNSNSSLALLTTLSLTTLTNADVPVSIFSYTPYLQQRECVKDCIWHSGFTAKDLIVALGCSGPWVNECYCSGNDNYEHASTASSFLQSCVADSCRTPSTDMLVTSAFGVYNEYCAEAGMAIPLVVASTTGSGEVTGVVTESVGRGEPTAGFEDGTGSLGTGSGEFHHLAFSLSLCTFLPTLSWPIYYYITRLIHRCESRDSSRFYRRCLGTGCICCHYMASQGQGSCISFQT